MLCSCPKCHSGKPNGFDILTALLVVVFFLWIIGAL